MKRTQDLVSAAHAVLDSCNLKLSPSKVSRIVRTYQHRVEENGLPFFAFLTNHLELSDEQQGRVAELDYLDYRPFKHPDPIGEHATNRALGTGRRKALHANE
jgi:hypothetical protein